MPTVASFDGIKIEMYFDEHPPPHFHARYAEFVAQIGIMDLNVIKGSLPPAQLRAVREWADRRRSLLAERWTAIEQNAYPEKIL